MAWVRVYGKLNAGSVSLLCVTSCTFWLWNGWSCTHKVLLYCSSWFVPISPAPPPSLYLQVVLIMQNKNIQGCAGYQPIPTHSICPGWQIPEWFAALMHVLGASSSANQIHRWWMLSFVVAVLGWMLVRPRSLVWKVRGLYYRASKCPGLGCVRNQTLSFHSLYRSRLVQS